MKNTLKQTFLYGLSNIAIKAAGLVLIPFYTGSLTSSDYGQLVILEIIAQFVVGLVSFQIPQAFLRLGSNLKNLGERKELYSTCFALLLCFSVCFGFLFFPLASILSESIFSSESFEPILQLLTLSIILEVVGLLPLQLLRLQEKSTAYLSLVTLKLLTLIVAVWYLVVLNGEGVYGAIKAIALSNFVFLLATLPMQVAHIRFSFNVDQSRQIYRYSGPLIFTTLAALMLTLADRLIIKFFGQFDEVGVYALAYKIGSLSNLLIIASFSLGFLPIAYRKFDQPDFKSFFSKTMTLYLSLTILLTLVISVFGEEIVVLLSRGETSFWAAAILVPFIAFIFIFKALNNYLSYIFLIAKKTKNHAFVTIIGVCLNIILNFLFIPNYGIYGAVAATGLSYVTMCLISYVKAQRLVKITYDFKRIFLLIISSVIAIVVAMLLGEMSLILKLGIKVVIVSIFLLFILFIVVKREERAQLKTDLREFKKKLNLKHRE
ncbi:MAG: polysaccharide biosynthesis C-terminal domain-containing protein [Bacteroidota bacterium]